MGFKVYEDTIVTPESAFFYIVSKCRQYWVSLPKYPTPIVKNPVSHTFERFGYIFESAQDFAEYLEVCGLNVIKRYNRIKHSVFYKVIFKSLPQLLWIPINLEENMSADYTPSERRELAVNRGLQRLNDMKQRQLAQASPDTLHGAWLQLGENERNLYLDYINTLQNLQIAGRLDDSLTELDMHRIAMLKVCENLGLVKMVQLAADSISDEDDALAFNAKVSYANIARMMGNEAQRVMDESRVAQRKKQDSLRDKVAAIEAETFEYEEKQKEPDDT